MTGVVADSSLATGRVRHRWRRLAALLFLDGFRAAPAWMSAVTAFLVLGSIASTCYPLGYRLLVDGALNGSTGALVAGIAVVGGLLSLGWVLTSIGAAQSMALSDRISMFRSAELMRLIAGVSGLEHLERPGYLTQVERLTANRRQLATAPRQVLSNLSSVARIVTLLVLLASVSPWLLLLPLSAVAPMVADRIARRLTRAAEGDMATDRRLAGMIFGLATDADAAGELRTYGLADHLRAEHARLSAAIDRRGAREAAALLGVQAAGWLLYAAALMGAMGFVVVRAAHGELSLGTVLMSVSLIRRSRTQLASAAQGSGALVATMATADRLLWLQDHAALDAADTGTLTPPDRLRHGIDFDQVDFSYPGTRTPVLSQVSLHIPAGTTVAIVGENGSGKTTLVKLLLGMYRPDSGRIEIDGVPLPHLSLPTWRSRCSAAFQDFSRLHLTAVESVGVAQVAQADDRAAATEALSRAGADGLLLVLPAGLDTTLGSAHTGGHPLSGGQWQQVALGRAMRRPHPLLLVLDEPTASLDAPTEHALFQRFAAASRAAAEADGCITVLISHRFSTVSMAGLIVVMKHGSIAEVGSHHELLAAGGEYAELFALQAAGYR